MPDFSSSRPDLPREFLTVPIAHRCLHDVAAGRAENSQAAAQAAIAEGYGIELDVQMSQDGVAVVFHDDDLSRLTFEKGRVRDHNALALSEMNLRDGGGDTILSLESFVEFVAGRVPLLVELKDQSGCFGEESDTLARSVADALDGYGGPAAVMSFNPHSVAHLARLAPKTPRGLTTKKFRPGRGLSRARAAELSNMHMFDKAAASFISHDRRSLDSDSVSEMRARGVPVLTWTISSARQEVQARRFANNITFEGYRPDIP